ncbi:MAG TPA: ATP-binding protein [Desulfomonilia bacterium]
MIKREAEDFLKSVSKSFPVVAITGPRQSGKTTLARFVFGDKPYVNLENLDLRDAAENDPRGFLSQYSKGAVLDEIQRCPKLFSYLQEFIDTLNIPGLFVLTGSQQFGLLSSITQSLAGRVALLQLLPFNLSECSLIKSFTEKTSIDELLLKGFYPPVHDKKPEPAVWYSNYVQTYIERDVRQMVNIKDLSLFRRFVRMCASRTGQLLNLSSLSADCGITHNTAREWISILEASYIIFLLRPHYSNFSKRLIKTPKIYFYDTGLASWLLSIQDKVQMSHHPMRGALFETFVISEFMKSRYNRGLESNLYFWRDRTGTEVDLVVEKGDKLEPVEIKSGQTLNKDYFAGINKWSEIAGDVSINPVLIYGGSATIEKHGIKVVSWKSISEVSYQ